MLIVTPEKALPQVPDLNVEIQDAVPEYLEGGGFSQRDWTVTGEGTEFPGSMVLIYGVVKYRHLFSQSEVQTTFGYRLTPDRKLERLTAHPKYNENT